MNTTILTQKFPKEIALLIVLFISSIGVAQKLNNDVKTTANQFYYNITGTNGAIKNYYDLNKNKATNNYVVNYEQGGWVMLSNNNISGFSKVGEYKVEGGPLEKVLKNSYTKIEVHGELSKVKTKTIQKNKNPQDNVDPFLTDVWGGVNCFDNNGETVYPGNYYTPSHCSAGCVAISMSQILHFYEWPISGVGSNVYAEDYNNNLVRHASFFDGIEYDWDNMQDEYQGVASTDISRRAIGELYYSAACALEMNFEPAGSTSNINKTPFVYNNFFRYANHYEDVTWNSFWQRLYENIQNGYPVPIAVDASATGDGHVFIANGYLEYGGTIYYNLNWGWYNDGEINGWYNIQDWTVDSPGYNTITGASFDIMPNPQIMEIEATGSGDDFTVNWEVSNRINWTEFTLEQKVDQGSWEEVASGITEKNYTINNPTGTVYQFRVKVEIDGVYYYNSWSEIKIYAVTGGYDGYGKFEGNQYAYARQTPNYDLDFSNDYTFETWIRLKNANSNGNVIMDQDNVFGLQITEVTSNDYSVKFISHSTNATLNSNNNGSKIQNNQWAHIAITHTGAITRLFVNGELRDANSGTDFNLTTSNNALNFAERYSNGGYSGKIIADMDQIRISSTARYTTNFTPLKEQIYEIDDNTIAYFPFQDVHKVRLRDRAHKLSVKVKNDDGYVRWNFEESNVELLSNSDFELLQTTISVYPNPVINNNFQVSFSNELTIDDITINIYDINGRKIHATTTKSEFNSWNITANNLSQGMYVLVVSSDEFTATKKLIIK